MLSGNVMEGLTEIELKNLKANMDIKDVLKLKLFSEFVPKNDEDFVASINKDYENLEKILQKNILQKNCEERN